jgi:DNA polymerase (family 10)
MTAVATGKGKGQERPPRLVTIRGDPGVQNSEVAKFFREIADILELQEDSFKPRAYRRASLSIEKLPEPLTDYAARGELEAIPGVGEAIAKKIQEILNTGKLEYLEKLRTEVAPGLVELLQVPEVGPKTVRLLHDRLGITNIEQLREALAQNRLVGVPGFGARTLENLRRNLDQTGPSKKPRSYIGDAYPVAERIVSTLKKNSAVQQINVAGSLRRGQETIGDIDIVVAADDPTPVMTAFTRYPEVTRILAHGTTKSSVVIGDRLQVDLRVVEPACFGAALQYFTGSKLHNIALRRIAQKRGWKLSEYGLVEAKTDRVIAGRTEESIYQALGMPLIPPELREDAGEIDAALAHRLPRLVTQTDIRGDLHVHTTWSDGEASLEAMVKAAQQRKYKYIAFTDHSPLDPRSHGMDAKRLRSQIAVIRSLQAKTSGIHLLAGVEVDIRPDGTLDLPNDVLAETDLVVAACHVFEQTTQSMTERILRACENDYVDILAHPTGRIINEQPAYKVDLEAVFDAAKRRQIVLEINGSRKMDLSAEPAREAKSRGLRFAVTTDAHRVGDLSLMRFGVEGARRAWLEPAMVINTNPFAQLTHLLKHSHAR